MDIAQAWLSNPAVARFVPVFTNKREEGDLDLVASVRQLLIDKGLHDAVERHFDNDQDILNAKDIGSAGQQHLLNQYWNFQLLSLGAATATVRYYLTNDGKPKNWLLIFERFVLPAVVDLQLPRSLN